MCYYHSNYHLIGITLIPSDSNEAVLYALDIFDVLTHGEFYLGYLIHKALKSGLWHAWCQCISSNRLKIWKRVTYIPRSNVNTIWILVETYPVYTGIKIALFRCTFMGKCISSWQYMWRMALGTRFYIDTFALHLSAAITGILRKHRQWYGCWRRLSYYWLCFINGPLHSMTMYCDDLCYLIVEIKLMQLHFHGPFQVYP